MEKLLTIVIPVYNGEKYLSELLDSLIKAQSSVLEFLFINDGSTDTSVDIISKYAVLDDRIRLLTQENDGIVSARNKGLKNAMGKYVCFFDQDDFVEMEVYLDLVDRMEKERAQMGICSTGRYIRENKKKYETLSEDVYKGSEVKESLLFPLLFRGYDFEFYRKDNYFYGTIWKCIFSNDFLKKNNLQFKCFVSYEDDLIFIVSALALATTVVTSSKIGYFWRVNELSESHAGKYIENYNEKVMQLNAYLFSFLKHALEEEQMNLFVKVREADCLVEFLTNEWNGNKKLNHISYHFPKQETYLVPKRGIRRRMVLKAMNAGGLKLAYIINGLLLQ